MTHHYYSYDDIPKSFKDVIGENNYYEANLNNVADVIAEIIISATNNNNGDNTVVANTTATDGISW